MGKGEEWEAKRAVLKDEFDETLSDRMAAAIVTSILPQEFQDIVFTNQGAGPVVYEEVKDKVLSIAGSRIQQSAPTPMDIGAVNDEKAEKCEPCYPPSYGEGGEDEINSLGKGGKGNCYRCGGYGHMAKDCPTPEVKGNLKGGGKGYGDKGKSYGAKGYPGKGVKGETRECYNCGKKGHLSHDCWAKGGGKGKGKAVAEVGIEEVNESGEIWAIMQVDKLEISEVEKKKAIEEKISCYNRCYNRYKDDDSDTDDEEEESSVTFIGSKFQELFSQLGETVEEDDPPTMLKSADSSDDEEEDEEDPVLG